MIMNKFMGEVESYERTVVQLIVAGLVVLPYAWFTMGDITFNPKSAILLVVVGVVHTGFTYLLYFGAMKKLKSQTVAILSYIDPLVAVLVSVVVLKETMTVMQVIGGLLILGFTLWNEISPKEKN